ncbi:hypothetical protein QCA50_014994 [Cerrena zonata]|uniref:non-specific serine/threonine protein kinase n=1 Tax=Cerrena zonata TaxID=2478898 RepID=A0AAW0FZ35_9APHY
MALPRLPAPETSHFSGMSYEPSAATPSPTAAHFPQPRARDPALTNLTVPKRQMADTHSVPSSPVKPNMTSLPRAPQASAHKRSHSLSQRPSVSRGWAGMFGGSPTPNPVEESDENGTIRGNRRDMMEPPKTAGPELSAFAEQMEKSQQQQEQHQQDDSYRLPMPISAGATLVRKFGSLLGGGRESSIRHSTAKRGSIFTGGFSPRPSGEAGDSEKRSQNSATLLNGEENEKENEVPVPPTPQITTEGPTPTPSPSAITHSQSQPIGNTHRRAATIMDPGSRAVRHERRSSTGAAFFSNVGGTIGRHRRPSTGGYGYTQSRGSTGGDRAFGRTEEVDEQGEVQEETEGAEHGVLSNGADNENKVAGDHSGDEKEFKPVFLKGLFSVATTSTKQPNVIQADVRRVLDRMQVQYRETKTGFECIHMPSIDLASVQQPESPPSRRSQHRKQSSIGSHDTENGKKTVTRKTSKLSFGMKSNKDKDKDREHGKDKELPSRPSGGTTLSMTPSSHSSSFFHVSNTTHTAEPMRSDVDQVTAVPENDQPPRSASPAASKILPPIPRDYAGASPQSATPFPTGEVDPEVFESIGNNSLAVRFEINLVKVPWLPLHGIQFRRLTGDGWQYHTLARRVLTELKL